MQVLPQCGHAVHEDAPEKVGLTCVLSVLWLDKSSDCSHHLSAMVSKNGCHLLLGSRCSSNIYGPAQIH